VSELGQQRRNVSVAGERGCGGCGDVRTRVQAQQAEQPGGVRAEGGVRAGEDGAYVGGRVVGTQRVQPAAGVGQFRGEGGEGEGGVVGGAGSGDGQGEGQPGAAVDDVADCSRLGGGAVPAEAVCQQVVRLGVGEQVDSQQVGAVGDDEAGQVVAAGHHGQRGRAAGQQRPGVVGVAGVVQQDQDAFAVQQAAVEAGLGVQTGRDSVRRYAEGVEEAADRLRGGHHLPLGIEAAEVDVQLSVREPVSDAVRPVHGQRGLAHAGRAGHRGDHHGRRAVRRVGQQCIEAGEVFVAAGEPVHVRR
jgi:hypothetical protein